MIIQSNIHRILPKVNKVIYTFDTICEPNIMILHQALLKIFCSQSPSFVECLSLKRGIIQSTVLFTEFHEMFIRSSKSCTQTVRLISGSQLKWFSRYFVHNVVFLHKMPKSDNGDN